MCPVGNLGATLRPKCPQCGQKMIVHVGLTGDPNDNEIVCLGYRSSMIPLLQGPIVDGPFVD
jgi:hypothetical protein